MVDEHKFFEVTITNAVDTQSVGEGFIDNRKPTSFSSYPTTKDLSVDKERANMRWEEIVKMILETGADDVLDVTWTGGDHDNPPTAVTFKVRYRGDQTVWMTDYVTDDTGKTVYGPQDTLQIAGTNGVTYTNASEAAVVERAIATALSQNAFTDQREIYDPSTAKWTNKFENVTAAPFGTGSTQSARMSSIEGVGAFTVTEV